MKQPFKSFLWSWKRSFLVPSMFQMPEIVRCWHREAFASTKNRRADLPVGGEIQRMSIYLWHFHQPVQSMVLALPFCMVSQHLDISEQFKMLRSEAMRSPVTFYAGCIGHFQVGRYSSYKWKKGLCPLPTVEIQRLKLKSGAVQGL